MATPTLTSNMINFEGGLGTAYADISNNNIANSPKNITFYTNATVGVTISVLNTAIENGVYILATAATINAGAKLTLNNLSYGETKFKIDASTATATLVNINYTCYSN